MSSPIIDLLRDHGSEGFPADYLIARIRGRRAGLIRDWQSILLEGTQPVTSEEEIWESLQRELEWTHRQMNRRLRAIFAPMFLLFELKTIVLCLRNKSIENTAEIDSLLERSLLAESLRKALRRGTDLRSTIAILTESLAVTAERFEGLGTAYAEDGLKGFEDGLMRVFLEHVIGQRSHRVIKAFFESFIDLRNTMILYKHLRWQVEGDPPFITGGRIPLARFREALGRGDDGTLDALVRRVTGSKTVPLGAHEAALETVLLRSMTTKLHRVGRESEHVGLILDYVWRRYVQARNLALLRHAKGLDVETLEKELIL